MLFDMGQGIFGGDGLQGFDKRVVHADKRPRRTLAQERLALGNGLFNGVEVRGLRRQTQHAAAGCFK